ncbi:hypothetical protein LDL79_12750 [Leeuwenhoekiella palythoae]|uniref:hypothetical protein n=1 Tax=Leeuwenhoekiella palythoae TaxID=573501 RepID=UPI001CE15092|nr:hypothetical protein [Leeuwenhoekiella palythoae]UBZ09661.1 hypothetical protein LDL79_12750 [Leeuwenhoekiella palythoae]|tara:strand:- start:39286 stop:41025 length:1740 start_codon:yes stop_codon:yes gene_type:complete
MSELTFVHSASWIPGLIAAIALFAVFVVKEWPRRSGSFVWRLAAGLVAVLALLAIALKPARLTSVDGKQGVLLTTGYQEAQLDSLRETNPQLKELVYQDYIDRDELDSISQLFILGSGVKPYDLWQLEGRTVKLLKKEIPNGIDQLSYSKTLSEGEDLNLTARYLKPKSGNQIVLQAPGNLGLDSIQFTAATDTVFSLQAKIKAPGDFVYNLIEKDSLGRVLNNEALPVHISPQKQLSVVMLSAFPSFEFKYLKNYLAELNHQVLVRSQLTQNRFKYEYFNQERKPFNALSTSGLNDLDLLILDAGAWQSLSQNEQNSIKDAVTQEGLGVFVMPSKELFYGSQPLIDFDFTRTAQTEVELQDGIVVSTFGYYMNSAANFNATLKAANQILAGQGFIGFGSVSTTVLSNTYALQLKGNQERYKSLWSEILKSVLKPESDMVFWEETEQIVRPHEPYTIKFRTAVSEFTLTDTDGNSIPVIQDPDIPELWLATFYPEETGWFTLRFSTGDTVSEHAYYVFAEVDWKARAAQGLTKANQDFFRKGDAEVEELQVKRPINPIYFFVLFVLAMGYLWLEPKLQS